MHEYTVELRISGAELVPAAVTQSLGLEPSSVRKVGERKVEGKVWNQSLWGYNGFPSDTPNYWPSLEDGLTFLLDRLEPLRSQIDSYKQKYDVVWWCGHFQSSFDGGPTLSTRLMRRLSDFGVDLFIDNYFSDDTQTPDIEFKSYSQGRSQTCNSQFTGAIPEGQYYIDVRI